jgi:hypothetical protein
MRQDERETLRQRFAFRCGYCGVSEQDAGAERTVDHFQPRSQGEQSLEQVFLTGQSQSSGIQDRR